MKLSKEELNILSKLSKEELDLITVWRLVKKVCKKFGQSYYNIHIKPDKIGKHFYIPYRHHNEFVSVKETMAALRSLLKMDRVMFKYDLNKYYEKTKSIETKLKQLKEEKEVLDEFYKEAINKTQGDKHEL